jgi:ABC-type glutathione transport system ATPase component
MSEPVLEVKDLRITFRGRRRDVEAVRGCSIQVNPGEVLGLVGESGSGKSQLSLACMGLTAESGEVSGSIVLAGMELVGADKEIIRNLRGDKIAMIFQNPMTALNPFYRVGEQLADILRVHHDLTVKEARSRLEKSFVEVALPDPKSALNKFPHQFSGGQLQRIMIALAVSCEAKVLIADEPTTALDVTTQRQVTELLRRLVDELKMGLIFITHDMSVVSELADRVAVMREGEIIEQGTIAEVMGNPQDAYTQLLLASVPMLGDKKSTPPSSGFDTQEERLEGAAFLRVRQLSKTYPTRGGLVHALKDVDFRLMAGECTALVGESGSGKTTLAMSLLHLLQPSSGRIFFDGKEISGADRKALKEARRNISVVFQNPYSSLNPRMRILDIVGDPLLVLTDLDKDAIRQRVIVSLEAVGLSEEHLRRYPHAFSGGQRQRIALARALVLEPKLIILDEPTAALDVSVQAQVVELLNELRKRKKVAFFFITHDLALVERLANRVLVLYKGEIIERGTVEEVFQNPQHSYTKQLLASAPNFETFQKNIHTS